LGLNAFYEKNKNNYLWDDRVEARIYKCKDKVIADKAKKMIGNKKKNYSNDDLLKELNKDSQLNIQIEAAKYLKGENDLIDKLDWAPGTMKELTQDNQVILIYIDKLLKKETKTLSEAKGLVTSDYQNYLEKQWIESLRSKYTVNVNQEILKTVK
jgi:peptidyl-prolyl cis-trans isomerase SurA